MEGDIMDKLFKYKLVDGDVIIIKYLGKEKVVKIPASFDGANVVAIGNFAFKNKGMTTVIFPDCVKKIGKNAFYKCEKLVEIVFPKNLEYVGILAFSRCKKLTEITLPASVKFLDEFAFGECESLTKVVVLNDDVSVLSNSFYRSHSIENASFCLWKFLIKDMVFDLAKLNFAELTSLDDVENLSYIFENYEFQELLLNTGIINIAWLFIQHKIAIDLFELERYIHLSIASFDTKMNAVLFDYRNKNFTADEIEEFHKTSELIDIGMQAPTLAQLRKKWNVFEHEDGLYITGYKGYLTDEFIPSCTLEGDKIIAISSDAHHNFRSIKKLKIADGIEEIEPFAFYYCDLLEEIIFPNTLKSIGASAFANCEKLLEINISEGITEIYNSAFQYCFSLEKVYLPDTLTHFRNINGDNQYSPMNGVFSGCTSLKDIRLSNNLVKINFHDFLNCLSLEKIVLPKNLEEIDAMAFKGCQNLKTVELQSYINEPYLIMAFFLCGNVKFINNFDDDTIE